MNITPTLSHYIHIDVELGKPIELGQGRAGLRKIIPIIGGKVSGKINGELLNLGADWQVVHSDELAFLDTRYAIQTHDDAIIEIVNKGFRHTTKEIGQKLLKGVHVDPMDYYFRTMATLETGHQNYNFVNNRIFIGCGQRLQNQVMIDFYIVE